MSNQVKIPELPEVADFTVGDPSVSPYMVANLKHYCPPNVPEQYWNRIVEVCNEETELKDCWEPAREGKFRLAKVLEMALERLESLQSMDRNFTNAPFRRDFLRVARPTYPSTFKWAPTPAWSTKEEYHRAKESVKERYYHVKPNRPNASTKRYQQAIETGELEHKVLKELIRREKQNRKNAAERKPAKPCKKCGFGHQHATGCPTFTSADQINMMLKAVSDPDNKHPTRQVARSTRYLNTQLKNFA